MLKTKRLNNKTIENTEWGIWSKFGKNKYTLSFENRTEHYQLNELTGELYLIPPPEKNAGIITKLLSNKLKLIKKGN
jgi:hypothetical protein